MVVIERTEKKPILECKYTDSVVYLRNKFHPELTEINYITKFEGTTSFGVNEH